MFPKAKMQYLPLLMISRQQNFRAQGLTRHCRFWTKRVLTFCWSMQLTGLQGTLISDRQLSASLRQGEPEWSTFWETMIKAQKGKSEKIWMQHLLVGKRQTGRALQPRKKAQGRNGEVCCRQSTVWI